MSTLNNFCIINDVKKRSKIIHLRRNTRGGGRESARFHRSSSSSQEEVGPDGGNAMLSF
jgi:hypothetical protein